MIGHDGDADIMGKTALLCKVATEVAKNRVLTMTAYLVDLGHLAGLLLEVLVVPWVQ